MKFKNRIIFLGMIFIGFTNVGNTQSKTECLDNYSWRSTNWLVSDEDNFISRTTTPQLPETLYILASTDNPPYSFEAGDKVTGLNVDISFSICNELGLNCEIKKQVLSDNLQKLNEDNNFISTIPLRLDNSLLATHNVIRPIFRQSGKIVVRRINNGDPNNPKLDKDRQLNMGINDWIKIQHQSSNAKSESNEVSSQPQLHKNDQIVIGAEVNTYFPEILRKSLDEYTLENNIAISEISDKLQGFSLLLEGNIDGFFVDERTAKLWLDSIGKDCCYALDANIENASLLGSGVTLAIADKYKDLIFEINKVVGKMKCENTILNFEKKWLSYSN